MAICYHEEYFALGFLSAFFVFAIVTLFEDCIKDIFGRIRKLFI